MKKILHRKQGIKCVCCKRVMKLYYPSIIHIKANLCKFCYHRCESVSGIPRCHIERKRIGGYWSDKRSNAFTRFDGKKEVRNQKAYFENQLEAG